jgi:hypothetical protein
MIGFVGFVIIVKICRCGDEDREHDHDHDHGDEDHDGRLYKFDTLMLVLRNFAIFAILHSHGIISLAPLLRFNLNL